jgi:hypothetical protein
MQFEFVKLILVIMMSLLGIGCSSPERAKGVIHRDAAQQRCPSILKQGERTKPIIALFECRGELTEPVRAIVVVYSTGRVIFSSRAPSGGSPYFEGKIDPAEAQAAAEDLLRAVRAAGLSKTQYGYMSIWQEISITCSELCVNLTSSHDTIGEPGLAGPARQEIDDDWTSDYRNFRHLWERCCERILSLRPHERTPMRGNDTIPFRRVQD